MTGSILGSGARREDIRRWFSTPTDSTDRLMSVNQTEKPYINQFLNRGGTRRTVTDRDCFCVQFMYKAENPSRIQL